MMSKKALDATAAAAEGHEATAADAAGDVAHSDQAKASGGCPVCGAAFSAADVIQILPAEAEREGKRRWDVISPRHNNNSAACRFCCLFLMAPDFASYSTLPSICFCNTMLRELAAQRKPSKPEKSKDKRAREEHVTSVVSQVSYCPAALPSSPLSHPVAPAAATLHSVTAAVRRRSTFRKKALRATWKTRKKTRLLLPYSGCERLSQPAAAPATHNLLLLLPPTTCCCSCRPPPRSHALVRSKSTGILGHSEGAHWGGAQGYR
jgi:hypothetical protein